MNKIALLLVVLIAGCTQVQPNQKHLPPPTETTVKWDMEEKGKSKARREWIESLHRASDDVNWRQLEYDYAMTRHQNRASTNTFRNETESFANGNLEGRWRERGSSNQAGSVVATEYHQEENRIYTISAGGSLFSSTIDGLDWQVVNDDLRFGGRLLKFIEHNGEEVLVALINRVPHFSLDRGKTWESSTGIVIQDSWGNCFSPIVFENEVFVLSKGSYWSNLKIYRSSDGGRSYSEIGQLSSHDQGFFHLYKAHFDNTLRMVEKDGDQTIRMHNYNPGSGRFELDFVSTTEGFKDGRANMTGVVRDNQLELFFYNGENRVYKSVNNGQTWEGLGVIPEGPWQVGLYIVPSNPDVMLAGGVECHRSRNGGKSWLTINTWGEYYGDVVNKLHADMMYFNEFTDQDGEPFLLISNHGGLSISRDDAQRNTNIGLYGLNVSQYYSVRTDPIDSEIIYAGAQDQGLQRGRESNADWVDFDQVISGDYGHIVFTNHGQHLWTVYPGGWISFYEAPHFEGYPTMSYSIDSDHESVWIPPITPHPDPSKNTVYAAGGNVNGGTGSYVIELSVQGGSIRASQLDFDFRAASNDGKIGAISFSPHDDETLFVSTDNGYFFKSDDGGQTFERSVINVPGSHYLYGTSILPSKNDESVVYVGGSGYSTSPVVMSTDGGRIFRDFSDGLPPTLVFQLVANEDESIIFAATEAGPFAYVTSEGQWYDISGEAAPAQTYWSVEYLPEQDIARFGTYGRGIWDFEVEKLSTSTYVNHQSRMKVYPNPAANFLEVHDASEGPIEVWSSSGKLVHQGNWSPGLRLDISDWSTGIYIVKQKNQTQQIIKL